MRVLSSQEISAVSGGATTNAATGGTSPFTLILLGLFWTVAGLFGLGFTDFY